MRAASPTCSRAGSTSSAKASSCGRPATRRARPRSRRSTAGPRRSDAQDPVVLAGRRAAAVLVAREHVDRAVGAFDDGAQPAVLALEQHVLLCDLLAAEAQPVQRLPAQRREQVVAPPGRAGLQERRARRRDRLLVDAQRRVEAVVIVADRLRPAVVAALADQVDLVEALRAVAAAGAVLGREQAVAGPVEALRVAVALGDDLRADL